MKEVTVEEEKFVMVIARVNRYLIIMGIFFLAYFLLKTQVDIFLFFLALSNMAFALLSYKHLMITNRLAIELERAKVSLKEIAIETKKMHTD